MMGQQYHPHRRLGGAELSSLPANGSRSLVPYAGNDKFDNNMVVVLAALLCALICALGLNSIVRCALRCSSPRFGFEAPDRAGERLASTGLKKDVVGQIPVVVYNSGVNIPATDCPICLGEFGEGEKVRVLPKCNHSFHVNCIDTWLVLQSSCPTCRQLLFEQPSSSNVEVSVRI